MALAAQIDYISTITAACPFSDPFFLISF